MRGQQQEGRRRRKKPPITLAPTIYDRRVSDPPVGSEVIASLVDDAYAERESAKFLPPVRRDGTVAERGGEWLVQPAAKVVVFRSTRRDPLGSMYARGHVDDAEYRAGRRWQELYERSEVGNVQAVDTTKEPVDGGKMPEMVTDSQREAILAIKQVDMVLIGAGGHSLALLIRAILGDCLTFNQVLRGQGFSSSNQEVQLSNEFRIGLGVLAVAFGFAQAAA